MCNRPMWTKVCVRERLRKTTFAGLRRRRQRVFAAAHPASYVLGADTTVVLDGRILNKPADRAEAEQMLRQLSGRMHEVHTGIAVAAGSTCRSHVETTRVFVAEIPAAELAYYLSTGDSLDKAGAYGIQGYAARWIYRIEGDFFNVVGLPLAATIRLLKNG